MKLDNVDKKNVEDVYTTHDLLVDNRILFLVGEIAPMSREVGFLYRSDRFSLLDVQDTMIALDKMNHDPIKLVVDSNGGNVAEGLSLYDTMKSIKSPVYTFCRKGLSMGASIVAGGEPGYRYIYPHSMMLIHLPMGHLVGNTKENKRQLDEMMHMRDLLVDLLRANGVSASKKKILKDMEEGRLLWAEESIAYGLADRIVQCGDL